MKLHLKSKIRIIDDFPKKGISYKDITPLLSDNESFQATTDELQKYYANKGITKICGIESRGFIIGSSLAYKLNAGFVPIRKQGKLPYSTTSVAYKLEYGTDVIEIHNDAIHNGDIVLLHDDLLATGGTINAAIELISKFNPQKIYISFIVELSHLNGRSRITNNKTYNIHSLIKFDS
jgi:adenine phosphoribosyltransferase